MALSYQSYFVLVLLDHRLICFHHMYSWLGFDSQFCKVFSIYIYINYKVSRMTYHYSWTCKILYNLLIRLSVIVRPRPYIRLCSLIPLHQLKFFKPSSTSKAFSLWAFASICWTIQWRDQFWIAKQALSFLCYLILI